MKECVRGEVLPSWSQEDSQGPGTWRTNLITKYFFVGNTGIPFIARDLTSSQSDQTESEPT